MGGWISDLKTQVIRRSHRESLLYKNLVYAQGTLAKYVALATRGHAHRRKAIDAYLASHSRVQLHLGCGKNRLAGFINADLFGDIPIDITEPLPFADASVDFIYTNHLIEHIYRYEFEGFLSECQRVLKPGSSMVHATPSLEKISAILYGHDVLKRRVLLEDHQQLVPGDAMAPAVYLNNSMHILFGHKFLYDLELLKVLGERFGFRVECIANREAEAYTGASLPADGSRWDLETETFLFTLR